MTLMFINEAVTLALAVFVFVVAICRVDSLRVQHVQMRYAAPPLLAITWSVSVLVTMLGGDEPNWYQPLGLLAFGLFLYNNKEDWQHGPPGYAMNATFISEYRGAGDARQMLHMRNGIIAALIGLALVAAMLGAIHGQGQPLQIFNARAEPAAVNPGGKVDIVYDMRRVRACAGYVDRFIVNPATNAVAQAFERQSTGSLRPGSRATVRVSLTVGLLEPSEYVFRSIITHECPDQTYVQYTPDVPVVVAMVEPPSRLPPPAKPVRVIPPGGSGMSEPARVIVEPKQ